MIDFGERKDLLFLFIVGILLVLGFVIFSFISIWKTSDNTDAFVVGKVVSDEENVTDKYRVNRYVKRISEMLKNQKYDELFSYVAEDYIVYQNFDVNKLTQKIKDANLDKQEVYVENFTTKKFEQYNNVFLITIVGQESGSSFNFTLREKSPRNYDIAFDDFIAYRYNVYDKSSENVKLNIDYRLYKFGSLDIKATLTNKNSYSIVLNSGNNDYDYVLLNTADGYSSVSNKSKLSSTTIGANESVTFNLSYNVNNLELNQISGLTLRNVKLANSKVTNIVFDF